MTDHQVAMAALIYAGVLTWSTTVVVMIVMALLGHKDAPAPVLTFGLAAVGFLMAAVGWSLL